mgnify:CR=1 FL=1
MREELLQEASRKYGTPLYVFDLDILKEQTERIRDQPLLCNEGESISDRIYGSVVRPNRGLLYGRIPNLQETASSTGKVVYFRCYEKTR